MAEGITISDALIAVVGKRRAGKTTLMSKLFDKNEIIQLSDKRVESQSNCAYNAVEVPGPENLSDIKSWRKEELKKLIKTTGGKVDLFLLCIPAAPYNTFNEGTPNIMKGLQEEFGKDVWKRCIVVFTFNNMFLTVNNGPGNVEKDRNMYKANLQNFTDEFRNELVHKLGVNEIRVKTIFQHTLLSSDKKRPENTVITIPAGYHVDDPVIPNSERNWVDDLLTLIHEKCNQESSTFDLKKHQLQHIAKMGGIGQYSYFVILAIRHC